MSTFSLVWFAIIAATIPAFWLTPAFLRITALAAATLLIVAWLDPMSAVLLVVITFTTWLYTRGPTTLSGAKAVFAIGTPVFILSIFKVASAYQGNDVVVGTIVPLGLSFYTLRATHFAFERYLGRIAAMPFMSVAQYLLFLPTILIGPIHRYPDFERDMRRHRWDAGMFSEGLERMLLGAFKIAVLGNFLVWRLMGDHVAQNFDEASPESVYLFMLVTGLNLYFQFSGASDVAIGFARCLGFRVMENFNWPLLATSIPDFWRRWHISLTSLVREYVYAGITAISRNPKLAALATMLVIGLWHEISLRYVLWGIYHGIGITIWQFAERRLPEKLIQHSLYKIVGWVLTMHFVFFGFYFVRLPDPFGSLLGVVGIR